MRNRTNPLIQQLTHSAFVELAAVIRAGIDGITSEWVAAIRNAMPQMANLSFDELKDSTPQILMAMAQALASDDPSVISELVNQAPAQGLSRFKLDFDLRELMQEDRLLRAVIVRHVDIGLGRRMEAAESAALHTVIDVMLQRSVSAMVDQQKLQCRHAANTELKYLEFLSHDIGNNLNAVTMSLSLLEQSLKKVGDQGEVSKSLKLAQKVINQTINGMRVMQGSDDAVADPEAPVLAGVDLHALAFMVGDQFQPQARAKVIGLSIDVPVGSVVHSNMALLAIVLQNIVGNALKYSSRGTVHIGCDVEKDSGSSILWVSDEGPGIAPEKIEHIFAPFVRGESHGQPGSGLGLAIATQAAGLLGASLSVESKLAVGTTFRCAIRKKAPVGI